ncbi:MAG: (d)CMP kinase [Lachnospiraceae bacterium]
MSINIAIDGPAGAGKSTVAKLLSKRLGFIYIDTGAMYRAMALFVKERGISTEDEAAIEQACEQAVITIQYMDSEQQVLLNGMNVNDRIRQEEIGNMASGISVYPKVRKKLVSLQQELAANENVIMDGRDIGTCVLPDADVKIYLTASVKTRAERRFAELTDKGISSSLEEIKKDIEDRDYRDMNRATSPLRQAEDAVLLDTSNLVIEETVDKMYEIYQEKIK